MESLSLSNRRSAFSLSRSPIFPFSIHHSAFSISLLSLRSSSYLKGDFKYHRVEDIPLIDGVFVPNGSRGGMQITSTGVVFDGFLATDNNTFGHIWAGGQVLFPEHNSWTAPTTLAGVDYSSAERGVLFMHANKGITFDLQAVRQAHPNCRLVRFRSTAGNAETDSDRGASVSADLWVLVDGKVRFRRRGINATHGAFQVLVPLEENDRFLTLAATDGENGDFCDEIIFGDPRLEMKMIAPKGQ